MKLIFIKGFNFYERSFGFIGKLPHTNFWQIKMEIAAVMDNLTTLNSFRDKQTVSKAYKKANI